MTLKQQLNSLTFKATLTNDDKQLLIKLAKPMLTDNQSYSLMNKQFNRGIIAEALLKMLLGDNQPMSNKAGHDVTIGGKLYEFKYFGCGSKPSASNIERQENESIEQHADRIMNHYKEVEGFIFYMYNDFRFNRQDLFFLSKAEFRQVLINENCKIGHKIKFQKKNRVLRALK